MKRPFLVAGAISAALLTVTTIVHASPYPPEPGPTTTVPVGAVGECVFASASQDGPGSDGPVEFFFRCQVGESRTDIFTMTLEPGSDDAVAFQFAVGWLGEADDDDGFTVQD